MAGEFELIARYFSSLGGAEQVDLGVGDDCAILALRPGERLATSVDTAVVDVHFPADAFPEDIAYRSVACALSDLAAMGARPLGFTLAITLPEADEFWLHSCSEGLAAIVREHCVPLVGGDTTRGALSLSVQVMGALPSDRALLRSGACPGDQLCVSGTVGDAAAALAFLNELWQPDPAAAEFLYQRFYRPSPRLELGQALLGSATAAIDISDGLLADAGHIAAASGVRLEIDPAALPISAALSNCDDESRRLAWQLAGGDDYELLFTLPDVADLPTGCTVIGHVTDGEGVHCPIPVSGESGYQHFA